MAFDEADTSAARHNNGEQWPRVPVTAATSSLAQGVRERRARASSCNVTQTPEVNGDGGAMAAVHRNHGEDDDALGFWRNQAVDKMDLEETISGKAKVKMEAHQRQRKVAMKSCRAVSMATVAAWAVTTRASEVVAAQGSDPGVACPSYRHRRHAVHVLRVRYGADCEPGGGGLLETMHSAVAGLGQASRAS